MDDTHSKVELIGVSQSILNVRYLVEQVAKTQASVLILGESGTGKELIARCIHQSSNRHDYPFIPVNCAAIPLELLESELFGHEKGAFTGAYLTRQGRFELANGGTLFLDEIGDMPMPMQAKLLRVLQEHQFERVGSNKLMTADVRIIAATHKNLEECIKVGSFREDLYYRLNVFPIEVLPLRSRYEDIPLLLDYYLKLFQEREKTEVKFTDSAIELLKHYHWPGNVRELSNIIERLVILFSSKTIDVADLPKEFQTVSEAVSDTNSETNSKVLHRDDKDLTILKTPDLPVLDFDLKEHMTNLELALIQQALNEHKGVVSRAAKRLGLRRTTLVEKMKKYGIFRGDHKIV